MKSLHESYELARGADANARSNRDVAGAGDQFNQGAVSGSGNRASSERIPLSIDNQRAPYSDPLGSSSLLLLEARVRRATSHIAENQDASKTPVALQRWLSQNQDFPEYWHSHGGSGEKGRATTSVDEKVIRDEERQKRHKGLSEGPQGNDT